jgi:hypothetical protein
VAGGQQLPKFNVGDSVEVYSFGRWVPCKVSSPINFGVYGVRCGTLDTTAKAIPAELRAMAPTDPKARQRAIVSFAASGSDSAPGPENQSIGSRYGTREPRQCDHRKAALTGDDAKDLFTCDAEHEFGSTLYLVSDVSLEASAPRAFNARLDSDKVGIDATQPVLDIHATYNKYQCSPIPYMADDNPHIRNCDQTRMTDAGGSCFKNAAGEWHCLMFDFHPGATATATNVRPPTQEN